MLEGNGITGFVKKSMDKDLELESLIHIGLNDIGKSWEGKGLEQISSNGNLEIKNNYESDCFIERLTNPANLSDSMNLSALVVVLSLTLWGALWGGVGAFLSAPLTVIIMIVLAQFPTTRWIAVLLSADGQPDLDPDEKKRLAATPSL